MIKNKKYITLLMSIMAWFLLYSSVQQDNEIIDNSFNSGPILITNVDHQEGPFGNRFILEFNTEPVCNFVPKNADQAEHAERYFTYGNAQQVTDKDEVVNLRFLLPMTTVKSKQDRKFVHQINATKLNDAYSISFVQTDMPLPGYVCEVTFKPYYVGFHLEGFTDKGSPAIAFTFVDRSILSNLNRSVDTIRQTT